MKKPYIKVFFLIFIGAFLYSCQESKEQTYNDAIKQSIRSLQQEVNHKSKEIQKEIDLQESEINAYEKVKRKLRSV